MPIKEVKMETSHFWIFLVIALVVGFLAGFAINSNDATGNAISWPWSSSSSSSGASQPGLTSSAPTACPNMVCPDPRYPCSMIDRECKCTQGASPTTAPVYLKCVPKNKTEDCCSLVNGNCTGKCPNGKTCQTICSCLNSTTPVPNM